MPFPVPVMLRLFTVHSLVRVRAEGRSRRAALGLRKRLKAMRLARGRAEPRRRRHGAAVHLTVAPFALGQPAQRSASGRASAFGQASRLRASQSPPGKLVELTNRRPMAAAAVLCTCQNSNFRAFFCSNIGLTHQGEPTAQHGHSGPTVPTDGTYGIRPAVEATASADCPHCPHARPDS